MRTGAGPLSQLAPGLTGYGGPCHRTHDWSGPDLFVDWPQCPLAWRYRVSLPTGLSAHWPGDPWPLPDMTVPGSYPWCSLGLDTSRRKSTRPNWDTWLEVIWVHPPLAAPSMGWWQDTRVTRIRVGPLCRLASVPTGLVASTLVWEKAVPGTYPLPYPIVTHQPITHGVPGWPGSQGQVTQDESQSDVGPGSYYTG